MAKRAKLMEKVSNRMELLEARPESVDNIEEYELLNDVMTYLREEVMPTKYLPTRYSDTIYGCGVCGHALVPGKPKFCYECGKAIDWVNAK